MTYGKLHRFFLRTVASQGVLSIIDAQTVLERFTDEEQLSVNDIVKAINDEIRPFYQEIKITKDEVTNEDVIVFLSLADDVATKAQNIFTATELEYFRLLIEHIMSTESRQITSINAMNLVGSMKSSFTKTDAQKVLNTWCRMSYFAKEQDNYALGLRAIHEFEGYFRQNMQHAVEECFLCKHIVFRGYNCPGCAQAIHTRCLMRYLEKVQKWPCCKIDFQQEQLERLNNEGSRLQQTQLSDTSRLSEENNTVAEATQVLPEPTEVPEASETMHETQDVVPEISQRLNRKRKRQISPQTQVSTTNNDIEMETAEVLTTRRSSDDTFVDKPTQAPSTRRSLRSGTEAEPTKVLNTRRSKKNIIIEEPEQGPPRRQSTNDSIDEEPAQIQNTRRSKTKTVPGHAQVLTRRRSTKDSIEEEPKEARTTRSKKDTIAEKSVQLPNTRRSKKDTVVEEPADVPTISSSKGSTVAESTKVTRRAKQDTNVEKPAQAPTKRRTRSTLPEQEPVATIQESFENLDVTDEVGPELSKMVTRKRKQQ